MRRQLEEILLTARVFEFFHQIDHDFNNVLLNLFLKNRCMRCQLEEILLIARVFELFLQIDHDFNNVAQCDSEKENLRPGRSNLTDISV